MSKYYNKNFINDLTETDIIINSNSNHQNNTFTENQSTRNNNKNNNINTSPYIQNNNKKHSYFNRNSSKEFSKYINCKRHQNNMISFFCETDKKFPCSICISQHLDHKYKQFFCSEEIFLKEMNEIKKLYGEVEIKYFQNKKNSEKFFLNIKNHFDEQIHKINDYFDSLISILQDKKSIFISKMLIIYENFIKELVKFKSIFDFCDKSYSNLYQKVMYIENEIYKNNDYESFYNLKENIINEINNFSIYNDENFINNNKFTSNNNSMPYFLIPKKQIININDDDFLFGTFENAKYYLNNNKEEDLFVNDNQNEMNNIRYANHKMQIDNNNLIDSIANSTLKKDDNNNSIKKNISNLESFFEKNKNKNIFSSINSNISNINDSFIDKQLFETNSTLFLFNKNDVKNVFKQQDLDVSQTNFEKIEVKQKDKNDNKILDSPKFNNNINKTKYTSCNKEKRNREIIKKFLEKEDLSKNNKSDIYTKQTNINNEQNIYFSSNINTSFENNTVINTINNDIKINNIKKSQSKGKLMPKKNKNISKERKRSGSMHKNNKNKKINNSSYDLNNKRINSKDKKHNSKQKKLNNINRYFENSYGEENYKYENDRMKKFNNGFNENNLNQYLFTKNNTKILSLHSSNNKKLNNFDSSENHKNNIINHEINNNLQNSKMSHNSKNKKEKNNIIHYNNNRSNSNRYKKNK